MKLQNEYLIIVDEETSFSFYQFCNSTKRFNEFLETDKTFKIQKNKLLMGKEEYYNVPICQDHLIQHSYFHNRS